MHRLLTRAFLLLGLSACAAPDQPHVLRIDAATEVQSFSSEELFRSPRLSTHRSVANAPLPAHIHRHHEENVYVIAGKGRMRVGDDWHELSPGSLIHVPKGVVHALVPEGIVTALSVFSPPFSGIDREFIVESKPSGPPQP